LKANRRVVKIPSPVEVAVNARVGSFIALSGVALVGACWYTAPPIQEATTLAGGALVLIGLVAVLIAVSAKRKKQKSADPISN
jgi:hypothetical protein